MTRTPPRFPARLDGAAAADAAKADRLARPQRPLQQAAVEEARRSVPSGVGLDSAAVRLRMVERLRAQGIRDERVLAAMATVERHRFVDSALVPQAYEDTSLPIGLGQTISKPSVVARMLEALLGGANARRDGRLGAVLEIGTGCGYQAALLMQLARRVVSIERLEALHDKARANLESLRHGGAGGGGELRLVFGDGRLGHAPRAPYDAIVAAAGGEALPPAWLEQLAVGGRLVAPVADAQGQRLVVVDRRADGLHTQTHEGVWFVPLKSGTA